MKSIIFLGLLIALFACVDKEVNDTIQCSGFSFTSEDIQMADAFKLDSIQYSNGQSKFILSGSIWILGNYSPFSILIDSDFRTESNFKILSSSTPFDSQENEFECVLTNSGSVCELSWRNKDAFLYLQNTISAGR